ncbi:MAG TPA: cupin domain-containing protein [Steroidobacteraceae bacterium]|nr:cupin domain-containing protein [Steroidobacteraceae bacterium]
MRTRLLPMIALCAGATLLAVAADRSSHSEPGFVRLTPEEIRWQDIPDGHGAQIATIAGDPSKPGLYVQRVRFPPHVMDRPHWHPGDRYVTVVKGTWFTGTGATFDPAKTVPLKAGSYMFHPARALHWDGSNSDEEVIVQVVGLGPLETTQGEPGKPFWVHLDH